MRTAVLSCVFALAACKSGAPEPTSNMKDAYLAIGARLAADSTTDVGKMADNVIAGGKDKASAAGVSSLVSGAEAVKNPDLAEARKGFRTMSTGMIQYLVATPAERAGLQLVHCPMTFDGEGAYWVQAEGKVNNPYEGTKMLTCGEITKWEEAPAS